MLMKEPGRKKHEAASRIPTTARLLDEHGDDRERRADPLLPVHRDNLMPHALRRRA
jgi:hypothetical protein